MQLLNNFKAQAKMNPYCPVYEQFESLTYSSIKIYILYAFYTISKNICVHKLFRKFYIFGNLNGL